MRIHGLKHCSVKIVIASLRLAPRIVSAILSCRERSATRWYTLGQAIGRAIESYPEDLKVVVLGTGGLSHQLDGTRAGFINKDFDLMCMHKLVSEPLALTCYSNVELIKLAGSQGVELLMWLTARGALTGRVSSVHSNYHIPISNTAAGLLVLENRCANSPSNIGVAD